MNREEWNELVSNNLPAFGGFLESYEWGEFQQAIGREVRRVVSEDGKIIAQGIKMPLPLGMFYWSFPKGPLGNYSENEVLEFLGNEFDEATFLRIEPSIDCNLLQTKSIQPEVTTLLNLDLTVEELWQNMKSKTRYNARLAAKRDVEFRIVNWKDGIEDFLHLMEQTTIRDGFRAHSSSYYKTLLEVLAPKRDVSAFIAEAVYKGRVLASNIIIDAFDTRIYLHGATGNLHRNLMPQYGLHAFLIEDAKEKGFSKFDFWGIAPKGQEKHQLSGVTRYKLGFGGDYVEMPGTYDRIIKHGSYGIYRAARTLRRLI